MEFLYKIKWKTKTYPWNLNLKIDKWLIFKSLFIYSFFLWCIRLSAAFTRKKCRNIHYRVLLGCPRFLHYIPVQITQIFTEQPALVCDSSLFHKFINYPFMFNNASINVQWNRVTTIQSSQAEYLHE